MVASYCTVAGEGVPDFVVAVQILGPRSEIAVVQENGFPRRLQMLREKRRLSRRTLAELCGLSGKSLKEKVRELLELVGLADAADRRLGGYSKGMLQRIGMAQALVQSPRLLVLDEPTAGVDPLGSRDIRNIIENLKGRGMTVFLCSHLLEQVQEVCDRVGVIFKGLLIAEGSVNELTRDSDKQEILLEHASPELMERLKEMVKEDGRAVWLEDGHPRNSLESVFLKSLLEWKEKHPNPEP